MTKKSIFWICLGVALLTGLIIWGSILTKNMEKNMPAVTVAPSTAATESTQQPTAGEETEKETAGVSTEETAESTQPVEPSQSQEATQPQELPAPTPPPTAPPTSEGEDLQVRIDALVQEVYSLKDYYVAKLSYLENAAHEEYEALPPQQKTEEKRRSIALRCVDEAYAMENECDARMDEICGELGRLLLKTGGRMNLVNEIRYAYAKEKEQAKTQFLEKYAVYFG